VSGGWNAGSRCCASSAHDGIDARGEALRLAQRRALRAERGAVRARHQGWSHRAASVAAGRTSGERVYGVPHALLHDDLRAPLFHGGRSARGDLLAAPPSEPRARSGSVTPDARRHGERRCEPRSLRGWLPLLPGRDPGAKPRAVPAAHRDGRLGGQHQLAPAGAGQLSPLRGAPRGQPVLHHVDTLQLRRALRARAGGAPGHVLARRHQRHLGRASDGVRGRPARRLRVRAGRPGDAPRGLRDPAAWRAGWTRAQRRALHGSRDGPRRRARALRRELHRPGERLRARLLAGGRRGGPRIQRAP
jgi:hypothetical protein